MYSSGEWSNGANRWCLYAENRPCWKLPLLKKKGKKMKIFKILTFAFLLTSAPVWACEDGTSLTLSDKNFCVSTFRMNWWSAFNWCESQGGHLPSVQEVCNVSTPTSSNIWLYGCKYGNSALVDAWLSTAHGTTQAGYFNYYQSVPRYAFANRTTLLKAMCIIP